jgi:hypothetical protein
LSTKGKIVMAWPAWFSIVAAVSGFAAAVFLYYGSIDVAHDKRTWKGRAPHELAHGRRQRMMRNSGFAAAIVALVAAVAAAWIG